MEKSVQSSGVTPEVNKRNTTIDTAKGLGIILIVLGHNWLAQHERGELFRIIFSFHVPLFFFLSGVFLNKEVNFSSFAASRFSSLLKPYFMVLTAWGIGKMILAVVSGNKEFDICNYFLGVMWGTGNTIAWSPLWFLPHLFLTLIVALSVIKLASRLQQKNIAILSVSMALLFVGIYTLGLCWKPNDINPAEIGAGYYPGLPWSIDLIPITAAFSLFGYSFREWVKSVKPNFPWLAVSASAFFLLHYLFNDTLDLNLRLYGNPFIATIQAALGIYIIVGVAAIIIQSSRVLSTFTSYLGSASLFILIFHGYLQVEMFFKFLIVTGGNKYYAAFFSLVACIVLSVIFWEFSKRYKSIGYAFTTKI